MKQPNGIPGIATGIPGKRFAVDATVTRFLLLEASVATPESATGVSTEGIEQSSRPLLSLSL